MTLTHAELEKMSDRDVDNHLSCLENEEARMQRDLHGVQQTIVKLRVEQKKRSALRIKADSALVQSFQDHLDRVEAIRSEVQKVRPSLADNIRTSVLQFLSKSLASPSVRSTYFVPSTIPASLADYYTHLGDCMESIVDLIPGMKAAEIDACRTLVQW